MFIPLSVSVTLHKFLLCAVAFLSVDESEVIPSSQGCRLAPNPSVVLVAIIITFIK